MFVSLWKNFVNLKELQEETLTHKYASFVQHYLEQWKLTPNSELPQLVKARERVWPKL